jgi:predicted RNA-binding protein associated with RNAse of E/G family
VALIHPPHRYSCDVVRRFTTNRLGERVPLRACEVTEFGLYTEWLFLQPHPHLLGIRSWALPDLDLRVISWLPGPEYPSDTEDFYVDVAEVTVDGDVWNLVDHYLDVRVWTGRAALVDDIDEFVAAVVAGQLSAATAESALATSYRALDGITAHGYDLDRWLRTAYGIELCWP